MIVEVRERAFQHFFGRDISDAMLYLRYFSRATEMPPYYGDISRFRARCDADCSPVMLARDARYDALDGSRDKLSSYAAFSEYD